MKESKMKGILYEKNKVIKEWQEPVHPPELIEAIKNVKESINEYLTHLVNERKVGNVKEVTEYFDDDDEEEEEEVQEDGISGLIKGMVDVNEKSIRKKKRKIK